jgi:hypothetical protein
MLLHLCSKFNPRHVADDKRPNSDSTFFEHHSWFSGKQRGTGQSNVNNATKPLKAHALRNTCFSSSQSTHFFEE